MTQLQSLKQAAKLLQMTDITPFVITEPAGDSKNYISYECGLFHGVATHRHSGQVTRLKVGDELTEIACELVVEGLDSQTTNIDGPSQKLH